jgi:hypothetical protein
MVFLSIIIFFVCSGLSSLNNNLWDYNNLVELPESIKTWWLELIGADSQDIEKSKVDTSWAEIDKILSVIPADISREQWLSVAMGIKCDTG